MDVWNWVLFAIGGYLAVTTLVRLMRARRDEVLAELTAQAGAARQKQLAEDRRKRREQKRKAA